MIGNYAVTKESINNIYDNGLLTKPTPLHSMYRSVQGGFIMDINSLVTFTQSCWASIK